MAYIAANLQDYEKTYRDLDSPMLIVQQIPAVPAIAKWVESAQVGAGSLATWTDRTDADYPIGRAWDGLPGLDTRPDSTSSSIWYLCFDIDVNSVEIDCAMIIGHQLGTDAATGVELEIADDADFSTNLFTVTNWSAPSDNTRLVDIDLRTSGATEAERISSLRYARFKFTKGAPWTPKINEVILGRRYQLKHQPQRPHNPERFLRNAARVRTEGGVVHSTLYSQNQFELRAALLAHETTHIDDIVNFHTGCRGPMAYLPNPNTDTQRVYLMTIENDVADFDYTGWSRREGSVDAIEQGPESYFAKVELG